MKYFLIFLLATSFSVAQVNKQKPPFQWEKVYTEGMLQAGRINYMVPFDESSMLLIGRQEWDQNFTRNFFKSFNFINGTENWIIPDSADGILLNTPQEVNISNSFRQLGDKYYIGYLVMKFNELGKAIYKYPRTISLSNDGLTKLENEDITSWSATRNPTRYVPISESEAIYLFFEPDTTKDPGYENYVIGYEKNDDKKSFIVDVMYPNLWQFHSYISDITKIDENTLEYVIGHGDHDTNCFAYRTIDIASGIENEVRTTTADLGLPEKNISIEFSKKIKDNYFLFCHLYSNKFVDSKVVIKLDKNGKLLQYYIIPRTYVCYGLDKGPNNSLLVHGYMYEFDEVPKATGYNQWLAQFSTDLIKINEFMWGTDKDDILTSIRYVDNVGLIAAGFYDKPKPSTGDLTSNINIGLIPESVFIKPVSVQENNKSETLSLKIVEDASAYSSIVLHSQIPQSVSLKLLDANGRLVSVISNGMVSEGEHRFALPTSLSNGMYLVVCEQNGTTIISEKFVIQK